MVKEETHLRSLEDVFNAFLVKVWWKFRAGNSLWANFMLKNICGIVHPLQIKENHNDSPTWRRMLAVRHIAELNIVWLVKGGFAHFWHDNWLGYCPV